MISCSSPFISFSSVLLSFSTQFSSFLHFPDVSFSMFILFSFFYFSLLLFPFLQLAFIPFLSFSFVHFSPSWNLTPWLKQNHPKLWILKLDTHFSAVITVVWVSPITTVPHHQSHFLFVKMQACDMNISAWKRLTDVLMSWVQHGGTQTKVTKLMWKVQTTHRAFTPSGLCPGSSSKT